jgi:hypothetical protein
MEESIYPNGWQLKEGAAQAGTCRSLRDRYQPAEEAVSSKKIAARSTLIHF